MIIVKVGDVDNNHVHDVHDDHVHDDHDHDDHQCHSHQVLASPPETHSPEQLLYLLSPRSANPGKIQKLFSPRYIETNINTIPGQYRDPPGGRKLSIGHFGT